MPRVLLSGDRKAGRPTPFSSQSAPGPSQSFQTPLWVIPIQKGWYFSVSGCLATSRADLTEIGCSSEAPPKMRPTFSLAMVVLSPFELRAVDEGVPDGVAQC